MEIRVKEKSKAEITDFRILPQGEAETPVIATRSEKRKTPIPPEPQDGGVAWKE